MLKLKYILFVYLIISKNQTQYAFMFSFIANYYLKKPLTNTHTHSPDK